MNKNDMLSTPGIDDNNDSLVSQDEFDDMLDELDTAENREDILASFLSELAQDNELLLSLQKVYKQQLKDIVYNRKQVDDIDSLLGSYQSLVLQRSIEHHDRNPFSVYLLSELYDLIDDFRSFLSFFDEQGLPCVDLSTQGIEAYLSSENVNIQDELDSFQFLNEHPIQTFRTYLNFLKENGIQGPTSVLDMSELLVMEGTSLAIREQRVQVCNEYAYSSVTDYRLLKYLRFENNIDDFVKKIQIAKSADADDLSFQGIEGLRYASAQHIQDVLTFFHEAGFTVSGVCHLVEEYFSPANLSNDLETLTKKLSLLDGFNASPDGHTLTSADIVSLFALEIQQFKKYIKLINKYTKLFREQTIGAAGIHMFDSKYGYKRTKDLFDALQTILDIAFFEKSSNNPDRDQTKERMLQTFASSTDIIEYAILVGDDSEVDKHIALLQTLGNVCKENDIHIRNLPDLRKLRGRETDQLISYLTSIAKQFDGSAYYFLEDLMRPGIKHNKLPIVMQSYYKQRVDGAIVYSNDQKIERWLEEEPVWLNAMSDTDIEKYFDLIGDREHSRSPVFLMQCDPGSLKISEVEDTIILARSFGYEIDLTRLEESYKLSQYIQDLQKCVKEWSLQPETALKTIEWFNQYDKFTPLQYIELFEIPGSYELFRHLSDTPHSLRVGGKIVGSVGLNVGKEDRSIHWFRGVLEMIQSRDDIDLPSQRFSNNPRKQAEQRNNIIDEYEKMLQQKISRDYDESGELLGRNTFDKIFYCGAVQDYAIKSYDYRGKLIYLRGEDHNGAFSRGGELKAWLKKFTQTGGFEEYSSQYTSPGVLDDSKPKQLIDAVENYVTVNHGKNILVYIGHHGRSDGSAGPFSKEDLITLANISPDVKIMTDKCHRGRTYDNITNTQSDGSDHLYDMKSPISGYSDRGLSRSSATNILIQAYEQGIPFHEAELYLRTKYFHNLAPMTELLQYKNFNTGEEEEGVIGIND